MVPPLHCTLSGNGADPNLTDRLRRTCLHRTALFGQRVELLTLLADNGANINATDCNVNTPLLSLCDIIHIHKIDELAENEQNCCKSCCLSPEEAAQPVQVKPDFLQYFLRRKDTEVTRIASPSTNLSRNERFHVLETLFFFCEYANQDLYM